MDAALADLEHRRRVGLSSGKAEDTEKRDESEKGRNSNVILQRDTGKVCVGKDN